MTSPHVIDVVPVPGSSGAIDVQTYGDHAYVCGGNSGLFVVNIASPSNSGIVGSVDTPGSAVALDVVGTYAYIAAGNFGFQVVDVANPLSPQVIGSAFDPYLFLISDVAVSGGFAYFSDNDIGVIDVTDPENPFLIGRAWTPGLAAGLAFDGALVYVADYDALRSLPAHCGTATGIGAPAASSITTLTAIPNPSRHGVALHFASSSGGFARASVFDASGRLVRTLHEGSLAAGAQHLAWDARDQEGRSVKAGVYFVRISTAREVTTGRVVLVR